MPKRMKRVLSWIAGATTTLLSLKAFAWLLIGCAIVVTFLALIYVFGPAKQSDRVARLFRLP